MSGASRVGVVDIGSNTVRLVIFETWRASVLPRFNEKVMAGLGTGLAETGRLSPTGWTSAVKALRRFRAILDGLAVTQVRVVATAASRVAQDGPAFVREAEAAIGVPVIVLSGTDEGRVSAMGVAGGMYRPVGLVADLGGSSMELHGLGHGEGCEGETHMLGPLALAGLLERPERDIRKHVRGVLKGSALVKSDLETIYAVGGAWRAMAKVDMHRTDYPLQVLHSYEMSAKAVSATVGDVFTARKSDPTLDTLRHTIAGRRSAMLPLSATVLDELVRVSGAKRVVISSIGLREGVVRELSGEVPADMLHDGAVAFLRLDPHQVAFGQALYAFLSHVFEAEPPCFGSRRNDARLYRTACLLADAAGRYHPDHRADMAYDQALWAPYSGLDHAERTFLALTAGTRYRRRFSLPKAHKVLLDEAGRKRARQLGLVMRLGAIISGRSASILERASLGRDNGKLTLIVSGKDEDLLSETVIDRHAQAAKELGLEPEISVR
ncbi:MAG: Ppx/GppA family phosphatase [Pseudomonadota bacterium]